MSFAACKALRSGENAGRKGREPKLKFEKLSEAAAASRELAGKFPIAAPQPRIPRPGHGSVKSLELRGRTFPGTGSRAWMVLGSVASVDGEDSEEHTAGASAGERLHALPFPLAVLCWVPQTQWTQRNLLWLKC